MVLAMCVAGLAQETKISQSELKDIFGSSNIEFLYKKLLCKKWEFKYVFIDQTKLPKLPENRYFDILFKSNGNYQLIERGGRTENGSWNYDQSKKLVYLTSKTDFKASVKSLEENELIITMLSTDNQPINPNRQIHFRSFNY
jgi:hypothetical protein